MNKTCGTLYGGSVKEKNEAIRKIKECLGYCMVRGFKASLKERLHQDLKEEKEQVGYVSVGRMSFA